MVEAQDRRAAMQVEALQLRLELLHLVDELQRVPERVPDAQHAADARRRTVGPGDRAAARDSKSCGEQVEVLLAAHAEAEAPAAAARRRGAQDERVVHALLPAAQVDARLGPRSLTIIPSRSA